MTTPVDVPGVEPHPWNMTFAWRSPQPPFATLDTAQAEQFDRDGFVVLEGVLDADELHVVTAEIDRLEAQVDAFLRRQRDQRVTIAEAGAITFAPHLAARSAAAQGARHASDPRRALRRPYRA